MFAARADQENAVHALNKPLNGGLKGLSTKTPGKTPFKVPLNDENTAQEFGKTGGLKTNGKGGAFGLTVGKNGSKLDKSAFVTPAGPRNRAPLGFKTTNAKATAFQTPAPLTAKGSPEKSQLKTVSPRLRRAKVKVHQGEVAKDGENEEREIEYMPPRPKPLPDYPSDDEFGPDKTFPQLAPENLMRGWPSVYFNPVDDNGVSLVDKRNAEQDAEAAAYEDQLLQKAIDEDDKQLTRACLEDLDFDAISFQQPAESMPSPDPSKPKGKPMRAPPTVMSKSAVTALSRPSKAFSGPSYAMPTTAAKVRVPTTGILGRKVRPTLKTELSSSSIRHATASAASHSTLGYAKGRAASNNLKKPLSSIFKDGPESQKRSASTTAPAPVAPKVDPLKELEEMIQARHLDGDDEDDLFGSGGGVPLVQDDEFADFQLKMPE